MHQRPLPQRTIGILGGASNVATVQYYRTINALVNKQFGGWDIAETLIVGMNFGNIEAWVRAQDWNRLEGYLSEQLDRLIAGRADVVLCASNTLHRVLATLVAVRRIPFLHIADPTGAAIRQAGLHRVALFGTRSVMQLDYLRDYYHQRFDLDIVIPNSDEIAEIDRIIFDELVKDRFLPESKACYLEITDRLAREEGVQGLILGCTEIALLIDQPDRPHLPMFDTTRLHCLAAVDWALAGEPLSA